MGQTVYKQDEQFISWLNGLYPGRMVEAVTTFICVAAYQAPWGSFNKRWQSSLTREPHCLYYLCHLRETSWRDAAEMAPSWLYLVPSFSHVFIIVHVKAIDQCLLTTLEDLVAWLYCGAVQRTCRPAFWSHCTSQLIDPLSDSARPRPVLKSGQPVYNPVEWLTNGSMVNNRAVTCTCELSA